MFPLCIDAIVLLAIEQYIDLGGCIVALLLTRHINNRFVFKGMTSRISEDFNTETNIKQLLNLLY